MQDLKMTDQFCCKIQDLKMTDHIASLENAGSENAGSENDGPGHFKACASDVYGE